MPCVICGYYITDQHHIIPKQRGGSDEPENLIDLCPNHHRAFHIFISASRKFNHNKFFKKKPKISKKLMDSFLELEYSDKKAFDYFYKNIAPKITQILKSETQIYVELFARKKK